MKLVHLLGAASVLALGLPFVPGAPVAAPLPGYALSWADEFNGTKLGDDWNYRTDSKHWSTQLPANVSVHDGCLWIALKKEKSLDKEYTAGGAISKKSFGFGYFEARFKVPPTKGWHTSFWLMRHDGSGGTNMEAVAQEVDICENDSIKPTDYGVNLHRWNPKPKLTLGPKHIATPDLSADFHIWGCEFTPDAVVYYFDGKEVWRHDNKDLPHDPQNIWLSSIGSYLGKTDAIDDSKLPVYAVYDYVRYFEKK